MLLLFTLLPRNICNLQLLSNIVLILLSTSTMISTSTAFTARTTKSLVLSKPTSTTTTSINIMTLNYKVPMMNVMRRRMSDMFLIPSKNQRMIRSINLSYCRPFALSMSTTTSSSSSSSSSSPSETTPNNKGTNVAASSLLALRLDGLDAPTVWQEFSPLSQQYQSINLGQGFPDWEPPNFVIQNMISSISSSTAATVVNDNSNDEDGVSRPPVIVGRSANQYARSYAHMPLANALADIYTKRWKDSDSSSSSLLKIDPATQVATATGCTNVLYCTIQGLINPGDEVILFEPAFDIYSSQVKLAGGVPKYIPLRPQKSIDDSNTIDLTKQSASDVFTFDIDELQSMITDRTKLILINTPHNPTGKMFSYTELHSIANIVQNYPQITIVSDEVYEHIIFDPINEPHISIATILPQQTLTLSSGGKTFSATGWKVGWAIGPSHLIKAITAIQQWVNFSAATPNQDAIAFSLLHAEDTFIDPITSISYASYYEYLASEYKRKRTLLINALHSAGMKPIIPPGGFFIMADTSDITFPYDELYSTMKTDAMPTYPMPRDWALSRWLTEYVGVTAIPPSAFYSIPNIHLASNMLRFAFCKSDTTIIQAQERFEQYFQRK